MRNVTKALWRVRYHWGVMVLLLSLGSSAFGQYNLLSRKDGAVASDKLAWSVSGLGDVNGDAIPDYVVGSPFSDPSGLSSAGSAFVFSGANGSLLYQKNGSAISEGLGYWVGGAGDVNADGRADFIVASQSQTFVYSGANGSLLFQKPSSGPVAGVGDVNGDGRADFIASSVSQSSVYSGANGALLYLKTGGSSVAGLGDVNGDGKSDFIVGDQYADPGLTNAGSAFVYSGATGVLLYQKNGAAASDLLGSSTAGAGDVNGDGRADFVVGARLADVGGLVNCGAAYVYSGATGALLFQKSGPAGEQWGESVGGAGDVNGDSKADFMVGSIWASPAGLTSAGSVFLYSGANGALLTQFNGAVAYENFGYSISGIGDIDHNGKSDVLIGGPNASPAGRLYAGSGYIFGNSSSIGPCQPDVTAPTLACRMDKRIDCAQAVVFDQPTATDNCDPAPIVTIVSTTQTAGPGAGEVTHTRAWRASDVSGNTSGSCSQNIVAYCAPSQANRSQVAQASATCGSFSAASSADLTQICYTLKGSKISKCTPASFFYYVAVTAPSASFTVAITQTRSATALPFFDVARNGVVIYDNCANIGAGTISSTGQAQATISGATVGKQYIIAVKYSAAALTGLYAGASTPPIQYDFAASINGAEITRDLGGLDLINCAQAAMGAEYTDIPPSFSAQSYPNPFNASAQISFYLPQESQVRIEIFNILGQRVRTLVSETRSVGEHTINWSGANDAGHTLTSGIYYCRIMAMDEVEVLKLSMLK